MPKERYDDRELALMADAAKAIEPVMEACDFRNLLYGKWSLLTEEIQQEHRLRDKERAEMFSAPQRQLVDLIRWNGQRGWGFSDDDIRDIEREAPPAPPPPEKGKLQLKGRVLEVHLPDAADGTPGLLRTFNEFAAILAEEQGMRPFHLFGLWPRMKLGLAPDLAHRPGLRWRTIDFGFGWGDVGPHCHKHCGHVLRHLPKGFERPHAGLLAAAAHFPLWLKRMDGRIVPYAWLPGYELSGFPHGLPPMSERIVHHPRFTRSHADEAPMLYFGWNYVTSEHDAFPMYADTKTDP